MLAAYTVNATLNRPNSPATPLAGAWVDISVPVAGGLTTDLTAQTGLDGTAVIQAGGVNPTGPVTAKICTGTQGVTRYWVDGGAGTPVYSQAFTPVLNQAANVTVASNPADPLNLTWNAFQIYETVILVYYNFAVNVNGLHATLPDHLAIHYGANLKGGDFTGDPVAGQPGKLANLQLDLPANQIISQPDQIGHEFGHYVAYESGFLNMQASGTHGTGFNARFHPVHDLGSGAPSPVLTSGNVAMAFNEGWADYFVVAAKQWCHNTYPALANKNHLVDYHESPPFTAMYDPWSGANAHQFFYLDATNDYYQGLASRTSNPVRISGQLGRGEDEEITIARILLAARASYKVQLDRRGPVQHFSDRGLSGSPKPATNSPITTLNAFSQAPASTSWIRKRQFRTVGPLCLERPRRHQFHLH